MTHGPWVTHVVNHSLHSQMFIFNAHNASLIVCNFFLYICNNFFTSSLSSYHATLLISFYSSELVLTYDASHHLFTKFFWSLFGWSEKNWLLWSSDGSVMCINSLLRALFIYSCAAAAFKIEIVFLLLSRALLLLTTFLLPFCRKEKKSASVVSVVGLGARRVKTLSALLFFARALHAWADDDA